MTILTATNIASMDQLLIDLRAFCVANAGFVDEGNDVLNGEVLYRMSRVRETIATHWAFAPVHSATNPGYDKEHITSKISTALLTELNFNDTIIGASSPTKWGLYHLLAPYPSYTFYTDGEAVFIILEVSAGVFTHLSIGNIAKSWGFSGGEYLVADLHQSITTTDEFRDIILGLNEESSCNYIFCPDVIRLGSSDPYIRKNDGYGDFRDFLSLSVPVDGSERACATMSPRGIGNAIGKDDAGRALDIYGAMHYYATPSATTLRAPLSSCYIFQYDPVIGRSYPLGQVPNIATINVLNLDAKELVNTDWRTFPRAQKFGDLAVASTSERWGIAYKEIP